MLAVCPEVAEATQPIANVAQAAPDESIAECSNWNIEFEHCLQSGDIHERHSLVSLGLFKSDHYAEVSLSDWLTHSPPQMVMQALNISAETLAKFPRNRPGVMPP